MTMLLQTKKAMGTADDDAPTLGQTQNQSTSAAIPVPPVPVPPPTPTPSTPVPPPPPSVGDAAQAPDTSSDEKPPQATDLSPTTTTIPKLQLPPPPQLPSPPINPPVSDPTGTSVANFPKLPPAPINPQPPIPLPPAPINPPSSDPTGTGVANFPTLPPVVNPPVSDPTTTGVVHPPVLPGGAPTAAAADPRQQMLEDLMAQFANNPDVNAGNVAGIDPTDDLRSSTILPGDDPALERAYDGTQAATNAIDTFDREGFVKHLLESSGINPTANSDRLNKYGTMLDESVNGVNGVDRNKMALELYQQFLDQQAPIDAANERHAKQIAAATGGLRSGRLRTSLGDLELQKENARNLLKRQLITDATSGSIEDQYRKAGLLSNTENSLAAREASVRGEQRTDRSNAQGQADAKSSDLTRRFDANRGMFDDVANESRAERDEVRGERGYEGSLEDQAFQRRLAQYQLEQASKQSRFQNGLQLLGAGESGNPADTLTRLANGQDGLDPAMLAQLAAALGRGGGGAPLPAGVAQVLKDLPPEVIKNATSSIGV